MKWFLGILLFLIGVFFLGINLGAWSYGTFEQVWRFWPLLLIILGIAFLVRSWSLGWIIVLLAFIFSAAFIIYAIKNPTKIKFKETENIAQKNLQEYTISESLPSGAEKATVVIDAGAVDLDLKVDSTDKLIDGTLKSNFTSPDFTFLNDRGNIIANLKTTKTDDIGRLGLNMKNELSLNLNSVLPLSLSINSGASSMDLDLSNAKLSSLVLNTGASSLDLKLGEKIDNNAVVVIKAGASSMDIEIPKDLGVKIITKTALSGKNFEGFDKINSNTYQSKNYDNASKKFEITIDAGVSSIDVETY